MFQNALSMTILLQEFNEKEADITGLLEEETLGDQILDEKRKDQTKRGYIKRSSFYLKKTTKEQLEDLAQAFTKLISTYYSKLLANQWAGHGQNKEIFERIVKFTDLIMEAPEFNYLLIEGKNIQRMVKSSNSKLLWIEGIRGPELSSYSLPMISFRSKLLGRIIEMACVEDKGNAVINNDIFKAFYIRCSLYLFSGLEPARKRQMVKFKAESEALDERNKLEHPHQDGESSKDSDLLTNRRKGSEDDPNWLVLDENDVEETPKESQLDTQQTSYDTQNSANEISDSREQTSNQPVEGHRDIKLRLKFRRESDNHSWIDRELFGKLLEAMDFFFQFSNIEDYLMNASSSSMPVSKDLIYQAQIGKEGKTLLYLQLYHLLTLGLQLAVDEQDIEMLGLVLSLFEKLFLNLLVMSEIQRKVFMSDKAKSIEATLLRILRNLATATKSDPSCLQNSSPQDSEKINIDKAIIEARNSLMRILFRSYLTKLDFKIAKTTNMEYILSNNDSPGETSLFGFTTDLMGKKFKLIEVESTLEFATRPQLNTEEPARSPSSPISNLFTRSISSTKDQTLTQDHVLLIQKEVSKLYTADDVFSQINFQGNKAITTFLSSWSHVLAPMSQHGLYRLIRSKVNEMMVEMAFKLESKNKEVEAAIIDHEDQYSRVLNYLKTKIEISGISAESVMRNCRFSAHRMTLEQRDINGLWCSGELRKYIQRDNVFSIEQYDYASFERNKFYDFGVESYTTAQKTRPFLKFELRRYWSDNYNDIFKDDEKDGPKSVYFALNSKGIKPKKAEILKRQSPSKRTGFFFFQSRKNKQRSKYRPRIYEMENYQSDNSEVKMEIEKVLFGKRCNLIDKFKIWKGFLYLIKDKLFFYIDTFEISNYFSSNTKELKPFDKLKRIWNVSCIRDIKVRRLNQRKSAIELFFKDGYSVFFNFNACSPADKDLTSFYQKIKTVISVYNPKLDPTRLMNMNLAKQFEMMRLTDRWLNGDLSNFEYLLEVNLYSGRSYNDLSQYPIFPWVSMIDYQEDQKALDLFGCTNEEFFQQFQMRDLSKNMGNIGDQSRLANYIKRYNSARYFDNHVPAYHFGSHYSTPAIVIYYMIRLFPFTEGAIDFQSGAFDIADRLFHSVQKCFKNAMEEMSDVRELIPEFFFLPELFLNVNKLNLGLLHTEERVNCVEMPAWSNSNPYIFCYVMRKLLESKAVSLAIHQWIDLVFGFKQTGQEAVENNNVFYYLTYEGKVDMDELPSEDKDAIETQVLHFGQTPSQLFSKPHSQMSENLTRFYKGLNCETSKMMLYKRTCRDSQLGEIQFPVKSLHLNASHNPRLMVACFRGPTIDTYLWETRTAKDIQSSVAIPFKLAHQGETNLFDLYQSEGLEFTDHSLFTMAETPTVYAQDKKLVISGGLVTGAVDSFEVGAGV